ncbi:MAG: hypothetical protein KC478_07560 [Bacteriovoracaceae bacterium]|nr:hypothetical protein [Bacteriovoracaceae bacterium]
MHSLENQLPGGFSAQVNAYLDGNLSMDKKAFVEELVASNDKASEMFKSKAKQRAELKKLVPNKRISKESLSLLKSELREVNKDLLKDQKLSMSQKIAKVLDTTILEF